MKHEETIEARRDEAPWPVMILAHNEGEHIVPCLDSLFLQQDDVAVEAHVMANGCTDDTEDLVRHYAESNPRVHLHSIELGDKCNAWNIFIHDVVPTFEGDPGVYFFMDGDARAEPGALRAMVDMMTVRPRAHAVGAVPMFGRTAAREREAMVRGGHLVANLYALRESFVRELLVRGVRMPLGLEGDDGFLGALVKWDLQPDQQQFDHERLVACPDAGFSYESMKPSRFSDWRVYWRRRVRYGRRRLEFQLLGPRLKKQGLSGIPADIRELYADMTDCRLEWKGIQTFFTWLAMREMRRQTLGV